MSKPKKTSWIPNQNESYNSKPKKNFSDPAQKLFDRAQKRLPPQQENKVTKSQNKKNVTK